MIKKYSQRKALLAITKASLRAIVRSPSAVIFSFAFPFVLILVFGLIGSGNNMPVLTVTIDPASDTNNIFYQKLQQSAIIKFANLQSEEELKIIRQNGKLAGTILIAKGDSTSPYKISLKSTTASGDKWPQLKAYMEGLNNEISNGLYADRRHYAQFDFDAEKDIAKIREYKMIDFILPGQLSFSLMSVAVFGVAFMFYNLRNTLVLKRFFATPVSRSNIILGEALSRLIFQLVTAIIIIVAGHYVFDFTLVHGWRTLIDMLILSGIGLLVFMGFGFIVSGVARSDSSIPPFANMITLPQFLLAGTFFPIDVFPQWLQPIASAMPLTYLNDALRSVAFEGDSLWDVRSKIFMLLIWGIVAYFGATKLFKWE